jgi:hypothetical protein
LITFSGKSGDISAADGILFDYKNLLLLKVAMQCIGKAGGEPVNPGPDNDQVFFVIVRD